MHRASVGTETFEFEFSDNTSLIGTVNGTPFQMDLMDQKWAKHVIHNDKSYSISIVSFRPKDKSCVIKINNHEILVSIEDRFDALLKQLGMDSTDNEKVNEVMAPMPGLVLSTHISPGDSVAKGDPLLVLEAMKMENIIKSPCDGIIRSLEVASSEAVEKNQILIIFES
jgi:biotin carboxyl carrier protein